MITSFSLKSILINFFYLPFISILVWLDLEKESVDILAILLMIDFIVGMLKSLRLGEKITYSRFVAGFFGKLLLLLIPIVVALAAKGVNIDLSSIAMGAIYAFIVAETISIIINIQSYRNKKRYKKVDFGNRVIEKSVDFWEKVFKIFN